jgi:integrase
MSDRVPSYRCKKVGSRQYACVSLPDGVGGRRDILLGPYGTKESRLEYARVLAEWQAADRRLPQGQAKADLTINELILAYLPHVEQHYRHADGTPTNELIDMKITLRPLKKLYGHTPAASFGPLALKALRNHLIQQPITSRVKLIDPETGEVTWQEKILRTGLARGVVNQRINRIRRLFKWGVAEELVPSSVLEALRAVAGLQRGRSQARETEPIRPVSLALVEDTLPHLGPIIADMIRLQLFTGARSGEICLMRACDIDMSGSVWLYRPCRHKTEHRGKGRVIVLGPRAQEIVKRYLKANVEAYLFSPREAMETRRQKLRRERKSKVQPSQVDRRKRRPRRVPGERYGARDRPGRPPRVPKGRPAPLASAPATPSGGHANPTRVRSRAGPHHPRPRDGLHHGNLRRGGPSAGNGGSGEDRLKSQRWDRRA